VDQVSGWGFTQEELRERLLALIKEFLGRAQPPIENFFSMRLLPSQVEAYVAETQAELKELQRAAKLNLLSDSLLSFTPEPALSRVRLYGLSVPDLVQIFGHLGFEGSLSEMELMRCVVGITASSSWERNDTSSQQMPGCEGLLKYVWRHLPSLLRAHWSEQIDAIVRRRFTERVRAQHQGLPQAIPSAYLDRFLEETGRDLREFLCVDPITGLSAKVCCYPGCPHYLKVPPVPLKVHLSCVLIPGFHKTALSANREKDNARLVAERIACCALLKPPLLGKSQLKMVEAAALKQARMRERMLEGYADEAALLDALEGYVRELWSAPASLLTYEQFKTAFSV
jgi:hypothetical protein